MSHCVDRRLTLVAVVLVATIAIVRSAVFGDANSQTGCVNQWLFNGVWRVQVTKVEPYMNGGQQTGWQVTEVWRNGTSQELAPSDSFLKDQVLALNSGSLVASATTTGTLSLQSVSYHSFAPAAQFSYTQVFLATSLDASNKPKAVDILFDATKLAPIKSKPQFTSSQYNFHFKLDCVATGSAAQAQGGSTQIAASEGCLNEWLSNGIWKMRATAIAPDNNNDPTSPQIGWMISEDWVNLAARSLAPSDVFTMDQYLVTASGNNVSSTNSAGTSMNQQQLTYRTFALGGSFTYQQRFRWSPLDPSDKPARLLVTFDATKQNARAGWPHYKNPANFRINLQCSK